MAVLLLSVSACQSVPSQRVSEARPIPEVTRYDDARARSAALRAELERLAVRARQELGATGRGALPTLESLRRHKREYFALREALFELALLHASAIVERMPFNDLRLPLVRTSLSLLAGTDLVLNFHVVATLLAEDPHLRALWNEADAEHRIPAGGWERALEAYRDSRHHDLFQRALERLGRHRDRLRAWRESGDADLALLYRDGVDQALGEAGRAWTLLQARFAEEDLTGDLEILTKLVERSKQARMGWAASAPTLREAIARDGGLIRGDVHLRVQAIKQEYLELREGLYGLAFKHYVKLVRSDIPYEPHFRLRAIGLSLLAAISLYENARQIETHLLALPRARALLNQGDPALGIRPGFWDHMEREFIRPEYQTLLELGIKTLEEADARRGTATPRDPIIEYVSNIDDLAILRPKPGQIPSQDIRQAITLAFSHIGKKYDFEFDNNTWDTIVCSELAFQTYVNVRWPFAKMLTSYTIAPDDIGVLAGSDPGRPFELVTFIHDGRVVQDQPGGLVDESLYVRVLGSRYDEALANSR